VEQSAWRGRFVFAATYFDQRFRDLIQYSPVPIGGDSVNYVNVGDATARGLELVATTGVGRFLTLEASYGLLRARDRSTRQRLQRRPGHTATLQAALDLAGRGSVILAGRLTGDRGDLDFSSFPATTVTLPAYAVVDASAAYRITRPRGGLPGLSLSGRVANLLDSRYQEVVGFPAPGRALFVAARLDFAP
jgi:vitamin B12 transporter